MAKEETESISFRINRTLLDQLRIEADDRRMSTNSLAIQIFSDYVDWHSCATKAGFVAMKARLVSTLLERLSDMEVAEIAKDIAKNESKDMLLILRNEYSMESVLDVIETWARISGYQYKHHTANSKQIYIIKHSMGRKWSLFLCELYRWCYENFGKSVPEFDISENIVSFKADAAD